MKAPALLLFLNHASGLPADADGVPPGFELTTDRRRLREAAAVVVHVPSVRLPLLPLKHPGQLWVAASMESEAIYPRLRDPRFMHRFDLTMTYRRTADVFNPYTSFYGPDFLEHLRTPPQPKSGDLLVTAFLSSRVDRSGRRRYLAELRRLLDVHSYGRVLRNYRLREDRGRLTKLDTIGRYKFTLAFENSIADDYVTEKFFDPLLCGSVPVVLGAPNVDRFAPDRDSYIDTREFDGPRELADHLRRLNEDDEAYARLHRWRSEPFRREFVDLADIQRVPALRRLCEAIAGRLPHSSS